MNKNVSFDIENEREKLNFEFWNPFNKAEEKREMLH
jgi:hypothetical protein